MTYQISITEEVANVAVTSNSYPIIINYNATNFSDTNTYGNANVANYLASGTNTANIITTANISGAFILGNGSQLTGLPATYSNANVTTLLAAFGSNTISTTGNITSGYIVSNGSALTNLTGANVSGTVANATYALNANASTFATQATFAGTANAVAGANVSGTVANATYALNSNAATFAGTVTTAAQPNITSVGILTSLSATGNITGNYILGNGSQLTDLPVQPGTYGNANVAANLAAFGSNPILTTGDITGGNLVATANLTSTQQTVIGIANVGTTGNIVVSGRNIATDMKWNPDGATGTAQYTGRVMVGTGWLGNNAVGLSSRLASMDTIDRGNTGSTIRQIEAETQINLTANVTNTAMRQQALGGRLRIGGGAAANTVALGSAFGAPFSLAAGQFNIDIGNASPYNLGNTSISHTAINGGVLTLSVGSSIGNAYGYLPSGVSSGGQSNITNYIGVASSLSSGLNITGNMFCFYNGNASTLGTHGVLTANTARAATNYYFLRNDDDVAQNKLGSLRTYHEFESATATSGSFAIDKATAQVHNIVPTGNCTITGYSNMVTSASDGTNTDSQVDTLTIIVEQGATPYYITLPTGATYKYAGNVSTVGVTANAVTMISVTAANVSGTVTYLTTVSPEFV